MAIRQHPVRLVHQTRGHVEGIFAYDEANHDAEEILQLTFSDREITGKAFDYFAAMCQIRNELEAEGWRPVCYGSSLNVYPSGMCRDMGRGLKAYKLTLRIRATMTDLVGIFDTGPDVFPSSVDEQKKFWNDWLRSNGIILK